ncbi:transketolase family protein [Pelosinus sp. UFO1]|uniref:transketolase family protein n=1 Tax=Pelosinus sp. UFO1 TaxID=484770 RepID=UPI0004D0DDB0|nr:transketolase C-terminal domain-containing protein [Pelosinus sp. UFO1]AIF49662.1 1-deoxy-D-xylulose-5-phosphate synthase [Pelosinus sp. UFO1]
MKAMREAYGEALVELGKKNTQVVALDADVSGSTRSALFGKAFPDRFFNVGIAEGNMAAMAAGFALAEKIPFINTFAFLMAVRATDPIRSLIAYNKLNVKVVGAYGGFSDSYDGGSHQAIEDVAIMRSLPNLKVVVPADEYSARASVTAVAEYIGPVYLRLSRAEVPPVYSEENCPFVIGKGNVLAEGKNVTIIANGYMVHRAMEARRILLAEGIEAEVIDMHTVKPIDSELVIKSATKTGAVVTAEEASVIGGLGSAVAEVLIANKPVPMEFIGVKDVFGESGDYNELLAKHGLDTLSIVKAARKVIAKK